MRRVIACAFETFVLVVGLGGAALSQDSSTASHEMYLELQHRPDAFLGQSLSFAGKVIQFVQNRQGYVLRVNVTPGKYKIWEDTIFVEYHVPDPGDGRIAEGEIVSVRGSFTGIKTYQSVVGDTIRVPAVTACVIQRGQNNIAACPGE